MTRMTSRRRIWRQMPLLVSLVVLWVLLWGEVSWLSAISGVLVALTVTRVFYLPPVQLSGRFNLGWALILVLKFGWQVLVASIVVARQAFRPGKLPPNAIIEVSLRTRSDLVMSLTAIVISLVPGTLVLEIDRERANLFLHVLAVGDAAGIEKARRSGLAIETSVIRTLGSRADLEKVRR